MDPETRRMLRAAFRAGYREGWNDRRSADGYLTDDRLADFLARVDAAGEVDPGPDDPCLRCGNPLGERVPMYVFESRPGGLERLTDWRMHIDCGKDGGNTLTPQERYELVEIRNASDPECSHTEHALRGGVGRVGRHFNGPDPAGYWEPCS